MLRPFRHRNYRVWTGANVVSVCGTWMQVLGLNWLVLTVTGSATAMGVSILLQALPGLVFAGLGGSLADRLPTRRLLVVTQVLRAALSLCLLAAVLTDAGSLWPVYAVTLASGLIGAVEGPAMARFGSSLVDPDTLGSALALGSVLSSGGRMVGMALGGVVAGAAGPAPLFLFNAVSFAGVVAAISVVRSREMYPLATAAPGAPDSGVLAGLRYLLRQPVVLVVLGLSFVLGSLGRNYQLTMAAMSAGPLDAGAAGYGVLSTVFAVGGVAGGLLAAAQRRMGLKLLLVSGVGVSALQFASGFAPGLVTFAVLILPIAAGAVIVDTVVSTRVQLDTREDMRGRMVAALGLVSSLAGMVGAPVLGALSDTIGARGALTVAGLITTAGCLVAGTLLQRLRGAPVRVTLRAPRAVRVAASGPRAVRVAASGPGPVRVAASAAQPVRVAASGPGPVRVAASGPQPVRVAGSAPQPVRVPVPA